MTEQTEQHYYEQEDTPNLKDPETALAMYRQQREQLQIEPLHRSIEDIFQRVNEIYTKLDTDDDRNILIATWDKVNALYSQTVRYDSAFAGADAALSALQEQAKSASEELESLLSAIEERETDHPKLREMISEIEDEYYEIGYESAMDNEMWDDGTNWQDGYDQGYENAGDEMKSEFCSKLMGMAAHIQFDLAEKDAFFLFDALTGKNGITLNADQQKALMILFASFGADAIL